MQPFQKAHARNRVEDARRDLKDRVPSLTAGRALVFYDSTGRLWIIFAVEKANAERADAERADAEKASEAGAENDLIFYYEDISTSTLHTVNFPPFFERVGRSMLTKSTPGNHDLGKNALVIEPPPTSPDYDI